jgi:hypothetical protein
MWQRTYPTHCRLCFRICTSRDFLPHRSGRKAGRYPYQKLIALDGVYTVDKTGKAKFYRVNAPNQTELRNLLNRVIQRVVRSLEREGLLIPDPEQSWLDLDSREPMDNVSAASIRCRIAIGPHSGSRTLTLHDPSFIRTDIAVKALTADRDGFSLNAAV